MECREEDLWMKERGRKKNEEEIIFLKSQVELYKTMYLEQIKYGTKVTLEGEGIKEVIKRMRKDYIPVKKIEEKLEEVKTLREKEIEEMGMSLLGSAIDILQQLIKENTESEE